MKQISRCYFSAKSVADFSLVDRACRDGSVARLCVELFEYTYTP